MLEWLMRQISLKNFRAIYSQVVKDDSLRMFCGTIAEAIYKEIDDPAGDREFCLSTLQAMLDKGWRWSNTRAVVHRLLPLHCQLEGLGVPGAERNQFYGSVACGSAARTLGNAVTMNGFRLLCRQGVVSGFPF